jgi:hypothetical protein
MKEYFACPKSILAHFILFFQKKVLNIPHDKDIKHDVVAISCGLLMGFYRNKENQIYQVSFTFIFIRFLELSYKF